MHVTSWLSRQGGGIPPVIWNLARQTDRAGLPCRVAGLSDPWLHSDCPRDVPPPVTGRLKGPSAFGYASGLAAELMKALDAKSVIHAHGLWMHAGLMARQCARRVRCPRVVSPHGMLEPWALENSAWKKRMAAWAFENANLHTADCLHALCRAEAENFRHYGLCNPIAIIPNGVAVPAANPAGAKRAERSPVPGVPSDRNILLFLARLHPKKGLDNLLRAWRDVATQFKTWHLVVAGSGAPDYTNTLAQLVAALGLQEHVTFCGPVYGADKERLLATAAAFVLPSFSEGFSMAVLEAAAAGLPVVLTHECNFPELAAAGGAITVAPTTTSLSAGLRRLLELTDLERVEMGQCGRVCVERSYTWPAVASQMIRVYQWLLGAGPPPPFVHLGMIPER